MKYLRALLRFLTTPKLDLWWGGFFLSQTCHLVSTYPQSGRTAWDLAMVLLSAILAIYSTFSGIRRTRKERA